MNIRNDEEYERALERLDEIYRVAGECEEYDRLQEKIAAYEGWAAEQFEYDSVPGILKNMSGLN